MKTFFLFSLSISAVLAAKCSGPVHIKSELDLDSIRHCQTFDGSITIQNMTSEGVINLSQLQHVQGDLVFNGNADLSQVVLAGLRQVDGELKFQDNQQLKRLDLTQLSAVRSLDFSVEPALDAILFPSGLSQIESMTVTDTLANKIEGLTFNKIKDVHIANNVYLKNINMNHLQQVGGTMTISSNSPNLTLDLSSLSGIYQGDFRNVARLIGLNRVQKVTGDLSFEFNTFDSLSLPNISQIAGTLTVSNNVQLTNLSVPELEMLGGAISLANNTQLKKLAIPKLEQVDGTVDITGSFDQVDLPSLKDVRGGLNVQTSSQQFGCDEINKYKGGVTKGHEFTCQSNVTHPQSGLYNNTLNTQNDDSTSFANGIIIPHLLPTIFMITVVILIN